MAETIKMMHEQRRGCDITKRVVRPDGEIRYVRCVGIPWLKTEFLKGSMAPQWTSQSRSYWGIYTSRPKPGRVSIDVYYAGLDRKVATYNRGTGQELRHSIAARLWRPVQTKERGWDFDYEGVWQFGTFGSPPRLSGPH